MERTKSCEHTGTPRLQRIQIVDLSPNTDFIFSFRLGMDFSCHILLTNETSRQRFLHSCIHSAAQ